MDDVFEHERYTRFFTAEELADFQEMTFGERWHLTRKFTEEHIKYLSQGTAEEVAQRMARLQQDEVEGGPKMAQAIARVQPSNRKREPLKRSTQVEN